MSRVKRRVVCAVVAVAAAMGVSTGSALAAPAQSAVADVNSGPFHIQFNAQRAAGAPPTAATGTFTANLSLGSLPLGSFSGPVTCLDVRGSRAGLFYPITSSSPSLFSMLNSGVYIYLQLDSAGKPQFAGFLPVPFASVSSCAPGLTLLPVTSGSATFKS
jgi:hypothetical protein